MQRLDNLLKPRKSFTDPPFYSTIQSQKLTHVTNDSKLEMIKEKILTIHRLVLLKISSFKNTFSTHRKKTCFLCLQQDMWNFLSYPFSIHSRTELAIAKRGTTLPLDRLEVSDEVDNSGVDRFHRKLSLNKIHVSTMSTTFCCHIFRDQDALQFH